MTYQIAIYVNGQLHFVAEHENRTAVRKIAKNRAAWLETRGASRKIVRVTPHITEWNYSL